jgi:hypothetical protein
VPPIVTDDEENEETAQVKSPPQPTTARKSSRKYAYCSTRSPSVYASRQNILDHQNSRIPPKTPPKVKRIYTGFLENKSAKDAQKSTLDLQSNLSTKKCFGGPFIVKDENVFYELV